MKKPAAIIGFVVLCLAWNIPAADKTVDFSGEWILNDDKSESSYGGNPRPAVDASKEGIRADGRITSFLIDAFGTVPSDMNVNLESIIGTSGFPEDPDYPIAGGVPLIIEQRGAELRIRNDLKVNGGNIANVENYTLDGKKYEEKISRRGSEIVKITRASQDKNKIKVEITFLYPLGNRSIREREYSLSKDGKNLTIKIFHEYGSTRKFEKQVYDKR